MNSYDISKKLRSLFIHYDYKLDNSFVYKWESDFFAISKSGYSIEVEIKISKSDFKADFCKTFANKINKHDYLQDKSTFIKPNKFYFAFPKGLIHFSEIPKQYGIIEIDNSAQIKRQPKFLHKEKMLKYNDFLKILMDKFYWKTVKQRNIIYSQKQIIDQLNNELCKKK